jgi:hypothetical protein
MANPIATAKLQPNNKTLLEFGIWNPVFGVWSLVFGLLTKPNTENGFKVCKLSRLMRQSKVQRPKT